MKLKQKLALCLVMLDNIEAIRKGLHRALERANRPKDSCQIIAVTKTYDSLIVDEARNHGMAHFGENKVQEAIGKFADAANRPSNEKLHLIGPLQSNKARQALQHFDFIHSVDRPKLVTALARIRDEEGRCPKLFIQVNTGEEAQKAGVMPADLNQLVDQARSLNLPVAGLMCIPPANQAPAPHFAWLSQRAKSLDLRELSMGMSSDYEAAAELGATYVRVGSALFGQRA